MNYSCRLLCLLLVGLLPAAGQIDPSPQTQFGVGALRQGVFRGQPVYFQNVDGWAVAEGDIILGKTEKLAAALGGDQTLIQKQVEAKSLIRASGGFLWPGKMIPYQLSPGFPQPDRVSDAIQHWEDESDIEFVERTDETDFLTFLAVPSGCASSVGRVGGEQLIVLSTGCSTGDVVHEIGHTVGLFHENQRSDFAEWVTIFEEFVDKRFFASNFPLVGAAGIDSGPYDYASIMHYQPFFFTRIGGQNTLETIPPGMPAGQGQALSPGDLDGVIRLYGDQPERTVVTTNPMGLKVTVDGQTFTAPRSFNWTPGSMHEVTVDTQTDGDTRYLFGRWSDNGDQTHMFEAALDTTVLTASFIEQTRIVTGSIPPEGGTVEITPPTADGFYTARSDVTITATPAPGFHFLGWSGFILNGVHGNSANPAVLPNNLPGLEYDAVFVDEPPVILDTNVPGTIVAVDGLLATLPSGLPFDPGTTHTIAPPPFTQTAPGASSRWLLQGWSDGGAPIHDIIIPPEGAVIAADFKTQHLLTTAASPPDRGSVFVSPNVVDGYYDAGDQVTIAGAPNDDSQFLLWLGDLDGFENPQSLLLDEQRNVTAFLGISRALESGRPVSTKWPEVAGPTLFTDGSAYSIRVPPGATQLEIVYDNNTGGVDVDLFVLRDFFPFVIEGQVVADHSATGPSGDETVIIRSTSVPPLEPGVYFIATAIFTPGIESNGRLTATVTGGDPFPEIDISQPAFTFTTSNGNPAPQTFMIENTGAGDLNVLINSDQPWLQVTPNQATSTMEEGTEVTVSIDSTGLPPGTYDGNIGILQVDSLPDLKGASPKAEPVLAPVTLVIVASGPTINVGGVVNAASGAPTVVPGGVASAYGVNLAGDTVLATGTPLPTTLGGVQVTVNGIPAPIFFVSALQINFQIPFGVPTSGTLTIVVTRDGVASPGEQVAVAEFAPGMFVVPQAPPNPAVPIIQRFPGFSTISPSNPAKAGDVLILYVTGVGGLTDPPLTGQPALGNPVSFATVNPTVTVGGVAAAVSFAGLAPNFVGVGQVNISLSTPLPAVTQGPSGPTLTLVINFGGASSIPVELPVMP